MWYRCLEPKFPHQKNTPSNSSGASAYPASQLLRETPHNIYTQEHMHDPHAETPERIGADSIISWSSFWQNQFKVLCFGSYLKEETLIGESVTFFNEPLNWNKLKVYVHMCKEGVGLSSVFYNKLRNCHYAYLGPTDSKCSWINSLRFVVNRILLSYSSGPSHSLDGWLEMEWWASLSASSLDLQIQCQ